MKPTPLFQLALASFLTFFTASSLLGQVFWERKAHGEGPFYPPGRQGDPLYAYYYPNNNNWSQERHYAYDNNGNPIYVTEPSNWSTDLFPRRNDVTLGSSGGGPTNYDRGATPVSLSSLTIQENGGLNMEAGTIMSSRLYNFQSIADVTLTVGGGGGDSPIMVLAGGGTFKKTSGTSTFTIEPRLLVENGGTIACDSGALQLPAISRYAGGVNFNAATAALIDLAPTYAVDSYANGITGAFTGINTGGTVRLSKGIFSTIGGTGGATFNFGGNTFQWTGGAIFSSQADPFTNAGTINVTGNPNLLGFGFTNKGTVVQSGAGVLGLPNNSEFTNTSSGVYDFRNDLGLINIGGGGDAALFINSGKLLKSGGTGTSVILAGVQVNNLGGTVQVDTGTLALGHGLAGDGGIFVVAAGGTALLNDGSSTSYYHGSYSGSGNGTVGLSGGELVTYGTGGATFNLPGAIFQWTGGYITSLGGAPFTNAGTLTIAGPVHTYNADIPGFTNKGTIIQAGSGNMSSERYEVTNAAGAIWDIRNDLGYLGYYLVNAGLFQKSAGNGTSLFDGAFNNSGMISVSSGTLQFNAGMVQVSGNTLTGGTWRVVDGGSGATLLINSGPLLINKGTIILSGPNSLFPVIDSLRENDGIFLLSNGRNFVIPPAAQAGRTKSLPSGNTVPNAGTLIIGRSSSLTVNDDYSQGSNSTFEVLIGGDAAGSGYHQLNITGTAALAGTLILSTVNGYTPGADQTFEIIHAGAISGGFVNVIGGTVTYTSTSVFAHPTAVTGPLQLTTAVSRKTHGNGQTFDIELPLTGGPGVECRRSGGNHTVVFTFTNEIAAGTAGVTTATGTAISSAVTFAGDTATVDLSGVPDAQQVTINLSGLTDVAAQTLPLTALTFDALVGDVNGDAFVNSGDAYVTRTRSGQTATATNFRADINLDGTINSGDAFIVRSKSGSAIVP